MDVMEARFKIFIIGLIISYEISAEIMPREEESETRPWQCLNITQKFCLKVVLNLINFINFKYKCKSIFYLPKHLLTNAHSSIQVDEAQQYTVLDVNASSSSLGQSCRILYCKSQVTFYSVFNVIKQDNTSTDRYTLSTYTIMYKFFIYFIYISY